MLSSITVNNPVGDIARSARSLERLGFEVDPIFAAEPDVELIRLGSMVSGMLISGPSFRVHQLQGARRHIKGGRGDSAVRVDSRLSVDEIVDAAVSAGCVRSTFRTTMGKLMAGACKLSMVTTGTSSSSTREAVSGRCEFE